MWFPKIGVVLISKNVVGCLDTPQTLIQFKFSPNNEAVAK